MFEAYPAVTSDTPYHELNDYRAGKRDTYATIEENLHESLTEQQYITRDQLARVISWKLDNQPGRRDRFTEDMRNVPDEFVRLVSEAALLIDDPKRQLHTLDSSPGVGGAMATVVLAFYMSCAFPPSGSFAYGESTTNSRIGSDPSRESRYFRTLFGIIAIASTLRQNLHSLDWTVCSLPQSGFPQGYQIVSHSSGTWLMSVTGITR